jgi:transcriptional regulator with XRE-family HTH domain
MDTFGNQIRKARIDKKLELKEVQKETGIDYTLLSRLESGDRLPSREQVFHLSDFYNLDRNELLVAWQSDKISSNIKDYDGYLIKKVLEVVGERLKHKEK